MNKIPLLFCTLLLFSIVNGQSAGFISGEIFDEQGKPLTACYVKITDSLETKMISYFFTGEKNKFELTVPAPQHGILKIIIGKPGYADSIHLLQDFHNSQKVFMKCNLKKSAKLLKGVTVTNTPVWKKDDTSFYRAKSFSDGTEYKLIELLEKIPDFRITREGELLYKNKIVENILVSGEDLFSDRKSLLLSNFPSDAIETIQAIENQTSNPLLKGLTTENKTIVNLGLKKVKLLKTFGALDAGINTQGKYNISPVLFSLYGKAKSAFIGNRNNTGNSATASSRDELQPPNLQWTNPFSFQHISFEQIQGLDLRYYINNNLLDTRFKINTPISKNVKSETELIFNSDSWKFNRQTEEQIQTDSILLHRQLKVASKLKPVKLGIQQKIKWQVTKKQNLDIALYALNINTSSNSLQTQESENISDTTNNKLSGNNLFLTLKGNYTNRITESTALSIDFNLGHQGNNQWYEIFSPSISEISSLSNPKYNSIYTGRDLTGTNWGLKFSLHKKWKRRLLIPSFEISHKNIRILDDYKFSDAARLIPDSISTEFTQNRILKQTSYTSNFGYGIMVGKMRWNFNATIGIVNVMLPDPASPISKSSPIGSFLWDINLKKKTWEQTLFLSFNHQPLSLEELSSNTYAISPIAFMQYQHKGYFTNNSLNATYYYNKNFGKKYSLLFSLIHSTRFNSFIYNTGYNRIYQSAIYEYMNRPTSSNSMSVSNVISLWKQSVLDLTATVNRYSYLSKYNNEVIKTKLNLLSTEAEIQWKRKMHDLNVGIRLQYSWNDFQQIAGIQESSSRQTQTIFHFDYKYSIRKVWFIKNSIRYFANHSFNQGKSNYFLWDITLNYKPQNRSWGVSANIYNLSNSRYFITQASNFPIISSTQIPLTPRNLLVTFHYSF